VPSHEVREFNRRIIAWTKKHGVERGRLLQRTLALEALRRLVLRTPVRTGRARGGWQLAINARPKGQIDDKDKKGAATIGKGLEKLGSLPFGCVVWIANNVEYIVRLEEGHSKKQAPKGMFRVTVNDLIQIMRMLK